MKIVLASASPRRKGILQNFGYQVIVKPSGYDEKINGLLYSDDLVINCAFQKALDVKKQIGDSELIIAADTVVVNNGIILGKPKDKNEAFEMLDELSNKTHFVATSICLMYQNQVVKGVEKTFVTFRKLEKEEIENYINTKNPLDKAGSYGIQDEGFDFAIKLSGELDNVIGFPMKLFKEYLLKLVI
ncbi:MAG: septum formation protein Maf [Candidatus Gastranaerophilales bacterium]|nr:septum formation protein Maf [Candidatus Gastranaerophilales bacterium]